MSVITSDKHDRKILIPEGEDLFSMVEGLLNENGRFKDALEYIGIATHACPEVIDGEDVPEKWQKVITQALRHLGEQAEQALSNKDSEHG